MCAIFVSYESVFKGASNSIKNMPKHFLTNPIIKNIQQKKKQIFAEYYRKKDVSGHVLTCILCGFKPSFV